MAKRESPWTVGRPAKGSRLREISKNNIGLLPAGQAVKIAFIYAWMPCIELIPAILVALMGVAL